MGLPGSSQCRFLLGRQVRQGRVLAALQCPDIGDDRPSIGWLHAIGEGIHRAVAVGDDVVEMRDRRLPQSLDVIRRRRREAALDEDPSAGVADDGPGSAAGGMVGSAAAASGLELDSGIKGSFETIAIFIQDSSEPRRSALARHRDC